MARVNTEVVVTGGSAAAALMSPRDGLVLEAVDGTASDGTFASFRQAGGALASYRRTVEVEPLGGDQYRARQVVELTVGLPWWSWLLALPLRHSLGKARVRTPTVWSPNGSGPWREAQTGGTQTGGTQTGGTQTGGTQTGGT